jgi:hypothetical protein
MCQQILIKPSSIRFCENLFIGSEIVLCGQTDGWVGREMKLIGTFLQFLVVEEFLIFKNNEIFCKGLYLNSITSVLLFYSIEIFW